MISDKIHCSSGFGNTLRQAYTFITIQFYFKGYHYPREYIAAQGPKANTSQDFWQMVLQHRSESIVMLTSLIEDNKVKCHEYFPKLNGQVTFYNMKITCKSEEIHANFIKRIMEVEKVCLLAEFMSGLIEK